MHFVSGKWPLYFGSSYNWVHNCLICSQNGWHLMTTGWIHHDFYQTVRVPRPKEVHVGRHGWHRRHRNHHENNPAPIRWKHAGEGDFIVAKKNGLKSRNWLSNIIFLGHSKSFHFHQAAAFWENFLGMSHKHTTLSRMLAINQYCVENV